MPIFRRTFSPTSPGHLALAAAAVMYIRVFVADGSRNNPDVDTATWQTIRRLTLLLWCYYFEVRFFSLTWSPVADWNHLILFLLVSSSLISIQFLYIFRRMFPACIFFFLNDRCCWMGIPMSAWVGMWLFNKMKKNWQDSIFLFFFFSPPGTICFLVTHAFIVEMNNKLILKSHCVLLFNFSINFSLLFLNWKEVISLFEIRHAWCIKIIT